MDEWVDVAYGPDAGASAPVASLASNDEWEDVAFGPPAANTTSFVQDLPAIGSRGLKGVSDLVGFAETASSLALNPASFFTTKPTDRLASRFEQGLGVLGVDVNAKPESPAGKVAGEIAYYAPSALIPGGSVGGKVASTVGAGSLSAIADMFGAGETGKAVAGAVGGLSPLGLSGISSVFSRASKAVAPITAEQEAIKSLGLTASKIGKMGGVDKVDDVIQTAVSKNVFAGAGPEDWAVANQKAIESIGDDTSRILESADLARANVDFPKWKNTKEFIDQNGFQKAELGAQFDRRFQSVMELWDGTFTGLNNVKQKLYKIAYSGTNDSKLLDRAIARDIKEAIETQAGAVLGDDAKNLLIAKNAEQGRHLTIQDAIEAATNKAAAQELKGPKQASIFSAPVLSAGGVAGSLVMGDLTPLAVTAGASLAKSAINSSAVRSGVSRGFGTTSAIADMFGSGIGGATGVIGSLSRLATEGQPIGRNISDQLRKSEQPQMGADTSARSQSLQTEGSSQSSLGSSENSSPKPSPITDVFQRSKEQSAIKEMFKKEVPMGKKEDIAATEAIIDQNPYYSALYEAESGRRPDAKNPKSSAKGGFQFIDATARVLKLDDPFDLGKSFEAVTKLTDAHRKKFGDDPAALYSAHYLGETVLRKLIEGKPLTDKQQAQVDYLKRKALPDFMKIYTRITQKMVEA